MYQRLEFVRNNMKPLEEHFYDTNEAVAKILDNEKYVTIISNIVMFKECNYKKCNAKDIRLKRCKKCVSVYYCSRLCQKEDWLSHKCVCKKLQRSDYSITLG